MNTFEEISMATYSIYYDAAALLVDAVDEGPDPPGAIGSNWQPGRTRQEAETFVAECLRAGFKRGHARNPRF